MTRLGWFLRRLIDPAVACAPSPRHTYTAFDCGTLSVRRLEERRVLAADLFADSSPEGGGAMTAPGSGDITTSSMPRVTVPGNQSTTEGAVLVFSATTGREIRIDAPGLGAGTLVVQITAFEAQGQVTPSLGFGSTAGLTVTGNGVNAFQLQGSLPDINAALSQLNFYSIDDGDFTITVTAADSATGDSDTGSVQVQVANIAPQVLVDSSGIYVEGSHIDVEVQLDDPGFLDNPQLSWTVSSQGTPVASGVGSPIRFFAASDGAYDLEITAIDKDGGINTLHEQIAVLNKDPTLALTGVLQNGAVHMTVTISDPGQELFVVEVFWTQAATTSETFFTSAHTFNLYHRYTAEELDFEASELTISVVVSDNEGLSQKTLNFREGDTQQVEPPEFDAPPQHPPPDRAAPSRQQLGRTPAQIASPDIGRALTAGTQTAAVLHQFVLRVVGPDGEESEGFPLPAEALANLPAFLASLGVPDGHYRVYLVTGDLERLVIDGHLRYGRIVDPADEAQLAFDASPVAEGQVATQSIDVIPVPEPLAVPIAVRHESANVEHFVNDESTTGVAQPDAGAIDPAIAGIEHVAATYSPSSPELVEIPEFCGEVSTVTGEHSVGDTDSSSGIRHGTLAGAAIAAAMVPSLTRLLHHATGTRLPLHRFTKTARLARKLARSCR